MSKHTSGKWRVRIQKGIVSEIFAQDEEFGETRLITTDSGIYHLSLADAYLISAAPELLEVCKLAFSPCRCVEAEEQDYYPCPRCASIKKAISKAEGNK